MENEGKEVEEEEEREKLGKRKPIRGMGKKKCTITMYRKIKGCSFSTFLLVRSRNSEEVLVITYILNKYKVPG